MTMPEHPGDHPDPWVNLLKDYVSETVRALTYNGVCVQRSWLDPRDPRDATIVLADAHALTWDEHRGWLLGGFVSGAPGVRTILSDPHRLAHDLLPNPSEIGTMAPAGTPVEYRHFTDRDGLDEALLKQWA